MRVGLEGHTIRSTDRSFVENKGIDRMDLLLRHWILLCPISPLFTFTRYGDRRA